jgi:hypothetical protein
MARDHMGPRDVRPLFSETRFTDYIKVIEHDINQQLRNEGRKLLDRDTADVTAEIVHKFTMPTVQLSGYEAEVDSSQVKFAISFDGRNGTFFRYTPSRTSTNVPSAAVISSAMYMFYHNTGDTDAIKAEFENDYENLKKWTQWLHQDVEAFNSALKQRAATMIEQRKEQLRSEIDQEKKLNS